MLSTNTKDFCEKKKALSYNSPDFERKNKFKKSVDFYNRFQQVAKKIKMM